MAIDVKEESDWKKLFSEGPTGLDSLETAIPTDLSGADKIVPDDDAVDFEMEDELADDEDDLPEETTSNGHTAAQPDGDDDEDDWAKELEAEGAQGTDSLGGDAVSVLPNAMDVGDESDLLSDVDDPVLESEDLGNTLLMQEEAAREAAAIKEEELSLLALYYPEFQPHSILKMNSLFGPKPVTLQLPKHKTPRPCVPSRVNLEVEPDTRILFKQPSAAGEEVGRSHGHFIHVSSDALQELERLTNGLPAAAEKSQESAKQDAELALITANWERRVLDEDDVEDSILSDDVIKKRAISYFSSTYDNIDDENEFDAVLEENGPVSKKIKLDMNDPNLLFVAEDTVEKRKQNMTHKRSAQPPTSEQQLRARYNISNDRAYDLLKENYQSKVRSTIGNLNIDHSLVALRLQSPQYKVKLSKAQMRSFHRPSFVVKPNTTITFSKIKTRKRKKDKGRPITEVLFKTTDLTLGDTTQFFLMEYSEELPLVISNFGMGSKLINYYRKRNAEDSSRPKLPTGETHVLGVQDRSAFWNFGFVEPGNVVPTLYNRMIRAPVFEHEPASTDFLMIRSTGGGIGQRYYLRSIPRVFVVGQTFPVTVIPGPHSRKVTTASKNRLKMIVYRILNKNEHHRLLVRDISEHFPDQNDMQNRQRLKEFMEYQRTGEDHGYWKIKAGDVLPSEEAIRAMITPEDIALLEAMQVGQQQLEDAGYGRTFEDDKKDEEGNTLEEQLAPWNITRNFINATQGKAMLHLHGDGDPTGCGEGFSFLRTSMKGGFRAQGEVSNEEIDKAKYGGHSYNVAEQQKAYDEEIARIWYTQSKTLSSTKHHDYVGWDESQAVEEDGEEEQPGYGKDKNAKVLRITRFRKDANGIVQRDVEVVDDPNVIRAYVKRRHEIEDSQLALDDIAPTNDEDQNKRRLKLLETEAARLLRNQDRRIARKASKASADPSKSGKGKSTTRRCASCGAVGHIMTNKACPLYNERYGGGGTNPPPATAR